MFKQPSRGLCWPLWTLRSIVDSSSNYVSWNCNQTFITEKLNAYSRSSCTRGETLACFKISGRNCFPCCAAAACQLHKNMWRFYCIYTHLIMIPNWRLIHTNTNIIMMIHDTRMLWGAIFNLYQSIWFSRPWIEPSWASQLNIPHILVLMDCSLSLHYLCPSHHLWPGASNTIKQRAEPPGTTPSTSPSHLLTYCCQPLATLH